MLIYGFLIAEPQWQQLIKHLTVVHYFWDICNKVLLKGQARFSYCSRVNNTDQPGAGVPPRGSQDPEKLHGAGQWEAVHGQGGGHRRHGPGSGQELGHHHVHEARAVQHLRWTKGLRNNVPPQPTVMPTAYLLVNGIYERKVYVIRFGWKQK